ncbi:hypothetical protein [Agaribacter marinus]|uniref:Uncharacterized protein n=1 Tax=Agaribacter marinus TaxID=1431249 RepID=A0AA37SZG3_9ALTE|nr:hypothetical protein [Agaribacter marinus]GLR71459.1 hypothetical protein GCM10007852_23670 [Agaribacter marinus]
MKRVMTKLWIVGCVALLNGCGDGDKLTDKIVEQVKTDRSADIVYANVTDTDVSFFIKNERFRRDVFNNDFKVRDLQVDQHSNVTRYKWLHPYSNTEVSIEDVNTKVKKSRDEFFADDGFQYWVLAWQSGNRINVSAFDRSTISSPGEYRVRIFANQRLNVMYTGNNQLAVRTEVGEPTSPINIQGCDDLMINNLVVNLCQIGTPGHSYLVYADGENAPVVFAEDI